MRCVSTAGILAALALAGASAVRAQSVPDLSGTWALQVEKSDFGPLPAPASRTDVIVHKEPSFIIKRTVVNGAGTTTGDLVYAIDGKPYKNTLGSNELVSTLKWEGQTLVMQSTVESPQGPVAVTDRFTLSADGKTLTQARILSLGGQEATQTLVLTKQP